MLTVRQINCNNHLVGAFIADNIEKLALKQKKKMSDQQSTSKFANL